MHSTFQVSGNVIPDTARHGRCAIERLAGLTIFSVGALAEHTQ